MIGWQTRDRLKNPTHSTFMVTMSEDITKLQRKILGIILADARRPSAITSIVSKKVKCNQNDVVQALLDLEKRGLAEKLSSKAWTAKGKAEDYAE